MIIKNIDSKKEKTLQLIVTQLNKQSNKTKCSKTSEEPLKDANISYGEIVGFSSILYKIINHRTSAIKKIKGQAKDKNDTKFYLSKDEPQKNSIDFSFKKDKILVLTCSLAFLGYIEVESQEVLPPAILFPGSFVGIADCFFQEKTENDISTAIRDREKLRASEINIPSLQKTKGDSGKKEEEDLIEMKEILEQADFLNTIFNIEFTIKTSSGSYELVSYYGDTVRLRKEEEDKLVDIDVLDVLEIRQKESKCKPCPFFLYDIDIPIFNGSDQLFIGPIVIKNEGQIAYDDTSICSLDFIGSTGNKKECFDNFCSLDFSDKSSEKEYKEESKKDFITILKISSKFVEE